MISNENILNLETRRKIYNYISEYPGLHLQELIRKMNLPNGTLRYHLNYLIKQEFVKVNSNKRFTRYFVSKKVSKKEKELFCLLRQDVPRRIIQLLMFMGPGDIYKNRETMEKSYINPDAYFVGLKSKKELIELTRYWKGPGVKPFRLLIHNSTFDFHLKKLLKAGIVEKIKVGREYRYRLTDEDMVMDFLLRHKDSLSNVAIDDELNTFDRWIHKHIDFFMNNIEKRAYDIFPHPYYC